MDNPTREARLQEREEVVGIVCIFVRYSAPCITAMLVIATVLTVWTAISEGAPDRAAMVVAIVFVPVTALAWLVRHFVLALLNLLDLDPPTEAPSTRR